MIVLSGGFFSGYTEIVHGSDGDLGHCHDFEKFL